MYNFYEEDHKYRVICTDDQKHFLLLHQCIHDGKEIAEFAKKHNLVIIGEEKPPMPIGTMQYIVLEYPDKEKFLLAMGAMIRRLAPFKAFDYMYPWFYRTKNNQLVTDAYYLHTKDSGPCPFVEYSVKKHGPLTKLELPHE